VATTLLLLCVLSSARAIDTMGTTTRADASANDANFM
jgi:hypothetical protein